jgi:hypothetical protein
VGYARQHAGNHHPSIAPPHERNALQAFHLDVGDHILDVGVEIGVLANMASVAKP